MKKKINLNFKGRALSLVLGSYHQEVEGSINNGRQPAKF